ncbi:A24 family peptidase [Pseudohoeflea coraliihabitans]|uniref:Prepilin peptidase n=1 Tax=Pseudohoeflea coraliihabitans TaxID=2860393 RepID=A0ABS6WP92_9HYPH|nr:prepilin peptidase [Pseudohoeflea sp. DP4N28-3]MBW3097786.1 prepilin peptidase [Pseudohoeflea sp. DP4N28-3]
MTDAAIFVIFPLLMAVAAFSDMFSMTIPNRVSIILALAFVLIAPFSGLTLAAIGWHLAAGLLVFVVCFALFALNAMGGGDAKILAASSIWFGFGTDLLAYMTLIGIFGGALTALVLLLRSKDHVLVALPVQLPMSLLNPQKGVPYGIAIGLAGLVSYPDSPLMRLAIQRLL